MMGLKRRLADMIPGLPVDASEIIVLGRKHASVHLAREFSGQTLGHADHDGMNGFRQRVPGKIEYLGMCTERLSILVSAL